MISVRCLYVLSVCLPVLPETLLCCGQTVEWIKMKLGIQVGLGPGHIVLDGKEFPFPKRTQPPIFGPYLLSPNCWMDYDTT